MPVSPESVASFDVFTDAKWLILILELKVEVRQHRLGDGLLGVRAR
jgi:hypothetical protein